MDINKIKLNNRLLLVEASAGTGKSFTLSHIVIRNIFENNINPENILLLSFTNNTCNELRIKIIERLDKLENYVINERTNDIDITLINWYKNLKNNELKKDKVIENIKNIKDDINKLTITTFHGFCKKIIDEYSIEISTKLGSKLNNNMDDLYENIINELWIQEYYSLNSEIIKSIENKKISTKYNNKEVNRINKKLFLKLLKEIDQENICEFNKDSNYKLNLNEHLQEYLYLAWNDFCDEWNKSGEHLFKLLIKLGESIEEKGYKSKVYAGNPRNKYKKINDWIQEINCELNENNIKKFIYKISKEDLLSSYFYSRAIFKESKKFIIDLDLSTFNNLQKKIYNLKDGFFNEYIRYFLHKANLKLIQLKERKNIINYNDLIKTIEKQFLNENIKDDRSINYLRNKYKCILIDEFQDTDNIQWNIIKKLFYDKEHFLFCVGDPKQAIYKFRGGDINTYLKAKADSQELYSLIDNYRTSNELIEVINSIYRPGLLNSDIKYLKLNAKNKSNLDSGTFFEIIELSEKETNIENFLINYLQDLLINNEKIDINKVAILTSYNYQCIAFKKLLIKNQLPCKIINKNNIFDTESSKLIEIFINCLKSPYSFKNIILLLTSKFTQIKINELEDLDKNKDIDEISKKCKYWSNSLKEKGFINLVNLLIFEFKSPFIINNNDLMNNLFQISEIIENELIANNYNLNNLSKWYKNQINKETRKLSGEEYFVKDYGQIQGINVSTIHSSKGLEYDIVICPYLWDIRQISKLSNGPIWKDNINKEIYINIENTHHKVQELKLIEERDLINESERLIYVALTRAKFKLVIFNNLDNQDNILNKNLLCNLPNKEKYIFKNKLNLKVHEQEQLRKKYFNILSNKSPWDKDTKQFDINKINFCDEKMNLRSSYSSWISKDKKIQFELKDYEDQFSILNNKFTSDENKYKDEVFLSATPLSSFPKGKIAGICLHKIIERYNFKTEDLDILKKIIREELKNHEIDISHSKLVQDSLLRVTHSSLGVQLQNKRLIDIPESKIIKEFKYDLALSKHGLAITSEDIAKCFMIENNYEFGEDYASKIKELKISSYGFHSGYIDCIIPIGEHLENSKWWIIDWKSNYISDKSQSICLPKNYSYENMKKEMIKHHYPLQSHLYLLALHRLLKWRLKDYNPINNLGGYIYIFLRGIPEISKNNHKNSNNQSPGIFIGNAPLKRINYLDNLFKHGSKNLD